MHPVSTVLFLAGYALALPVLARIGRVVDQQHRLALVGHQFGMMVAGLGWLLRGRPVIAGLHVVWMIGLRVWFVASAPRSAGVSADH